MLCPQKLPSGLLESPEALPFCPMGHSSPINLLSCPASSPSELWPLLVIYCDVILFIYSFVC